MVPDPAFVVFYWSLLNPCDRTHARQGQRHSRCFGINE
jgi:hypothetical protein